MNNEMLSTRSVEGEGTDRDAAQRSRLAAQRRESALTTPSHYILTGTGPPLSHLFVGKATLVLGQRRSRFIIKSIEGLIVESVLS